MRYQSPVSNPLSQYWEEELFFGGASRYWKAIFARLTYIWSEYFLANVVLVCVTIASTLSLGAVVDRANELRRVYGLKWGLKRLIDISGALVGIVLAAPFFLLVPILIKLDSPGPILFRQERIGKNRRRADRRLMVLSEQPERRNDDRRTTGGYGRPFMIMKFRTMRHDAEKLTGPVWAVKNDPRITRIGAFLRATRIDELPQLLNILTGDMSIVGPRPERQFFIEKLKSAIDGYEKRLLVRPGLTGLAQVEHKYDESVEDTKVKVRHDIQYVHNLNIIRDIKIILKTVYVVLAAKGM